MKKFHLLLPIFCLLLLSIEAWSADKIALTIKARGDASLRRAEATEFKPNIQPGTSLYNEDCLKTGKDGYAVLVFLDDKSQIKIRENSEMVISGTRTEEAISKTISMQIGSLKAEVTPQRKGDFIIATPTSVASVKGTIFRVDSDPVRGDIFYGISGSIEVRNIGSGAVVIVGANQTGTSTPDGQLGVEQTKEGSLPADEDGEINNVLRFQLQNDQGDRKEIKIEYK
jgi:hypothetical protein